MMLNELLINIARANKKKNSEDINRLLSTIGGAMVLARELCIGYLGSGWICPKKKKGGIGFRDLENFNIVLFGKQV